MKPCATPADQPVLGTLRAAQADYLVTGEKDLLALAQRHPIVTPAIFWSGMVVREPLISRRFGRAQLQEPRKQLAPEAGGGFNPRINPSTSSLEINPRGEAAPSRTSTRMPANLLTRNLRRSGALTRCIFNPQPRQRPNQLYRLHRNRHHLPHQRTIYSGSSSRFGSFLNPRPLIRRNTVLVHHPLQRAPIPSRYSYASAGSRSTSKTRYTATATCPSTAPSFQRANRAARLPPLQRILRLLLILDTQPHQRRANLIS